MSDLTDSCFEKTASALAQFKDGQLAPNIQEWIKRSCELGFDPLWIAETWHRRCEWSVLLSSMGEKFRGLDDDQISTLARAFMKGVSPTEIYEMAGSMLAKESIAQVSPDKKSGAKKSQ